MCGRTACTFAPDELCKACSVQQMGADGKNCYQPLAWREHPNGRTYSPSTNMAPSRYTPVIISEQQHHGVKRMPGGDEKLSQWIIQPMMWGLIPPFYKGSSATGHGYSTTNSRLEDVETKSSYKPSLSRGQRCVILCDGFYEWQTTKGTKNKQPYFIHASQPDEVKIWDRDTWDKLEVWNEEEGWKGPRLLKIAGLFSSWKSSEDGEVMSYSVLTREATKNFSVLHHRIPVILENDKEVENWLDFRKVSCKEALEMLRQKNESVLEWHPVSTNVNNSRNQESNLHYPISLNKKPPQTASSRFMSAWLGKAQTQDKVIVKEENNLVNEDDGIKTEDETKISTKDS